MKDGDCFPETRIETLQKVCDIYDWFDPAIDHIMRNHLKVMPGATRRTWEFAMIFLALHRAGKLTPEAQGLGMGAGTERLIFSIADMVGHVRATDLYQPDSRWVGVRTDDPQELLMKAAPWAVPDGRIKAERADMRDLPYPDDSFDFAWSTGAFEHIGEDADFVRHLNEVNRVLKPGGVYAFTTVVTFGDETDRIPHNYYFHPEHFADLMHASNLVPDPVFDCAIRQHHFNRPILERLDDYAMPYAKSQIHTVVAYRRGTVNAPNIAILRKDPGAEKVRPTVVGFDETRDWLWKDARGIDRKLWAEWQPVALTERQSGAVGTGLLHFGKGAIEIEVDARGAQGAEVALVVQSRRPSPPLDMSGARGYRLSAGTGRVRLLTAEGRLYLFVLRSDVPADRLRMRIRHARTEVQESAEEAAWTGSEAEAMLRGRVAGLPQRLMRAAKMILQGR